MQHTGIDITPMTNALLELFATLLLAAGTWAIGRLVRWLGLKNAAQATVNLDDALQKSVTYGLQQSQSLIKQNGWDSVDVHDQSLAKAVPYMIAHFPDALKGVGLDLSDTSKLQTTVGAALDRAFPASVTAVAASPATPPAVVPAAAVSAVPAPAVPALAVTAPAAPTAPTPARFVEIPNA